MSRRDRTTTADTTEPSGVVTAKQRAAIASSRPAPPAPPHLAIGYGPAGQVERSIDSARTMISLGLGAAFGAIVGRIDVIAFDLDRSSTHWLRLATVALVVGAAIGAGLRGGAGGNERTVGLSPLTSLIASIGWIALANTGDPRAVEAILVVSLALSVPHLFTATADARVVRPDRSAVAAACAVAAPLLLGITLGAGATFVDPDVPWATIAAVGGAIAALGCVRRLRLPDRIHGAAVVPSHGNSKAHPNSGTAVLVAACLGLILAAGARLQPYLAQHWQVGVRYQFLTLAVAGAVGTGVAVAVVWWHDDHAGGDADRELSWLATLSAAALVIVAVSQTLPGTVIGAGAALGVAAVALATCASVSPVAPLATVVTGVATTLLWADLLDAVGSDRTTLALIAAPALTLGLVTTLAAATTRPAPTPVGTIDLTDAPTFAAVAPPHPDLAPARSPLLVTDGVEFSYGTVQALFGVDLEVLDGEITAIVGANGAGKTTFLRTVSGLATPSAGTIRLGGRDLRSFSAADRVLLGINQIAAGGAVAEDLSVADNIAMFGHTLPTRDARAGAHRVLDVFPQFRERLGQRASSLSGGERQMLALAKSLVLRPRLLIVDELSLGLAPIIVSALIPVIRRLHAEGASVLLVEQSVTVALELADQATCMEKGRIVYRSTAEALRSDPTLLEAAYLEGISAALEHRGLRA